MPETKEVLQLVAMISPCHNSCPEKDIVILKECATATASL